MSDVRDLPVNSAIKPLSTCAKGARLRVVEIVSQPLFGAHDNDVSLRLKELGFLAGAQITLMGFGFLGADPLAIQVNGTKFALRRTEAAKILVEPLLSNR